MPWGRRRQTRGQLGELLASVQKYDAPPENVTTPSLEALQAYSLGYRAWVVKGEPGAAIALFQRAIGLDPNFAMAYARLGINYDNLCQPALLPGLKAKTIGRSPPHFASTNGFPNSAQPRPGEQKDLPGYRQQYRPRRRDQTVVLEGS